MGLENLCNDCTRKCCSNFKISMELTDPQSLKEVLNRFSFIHITGQDLVLWKGREKIVNVYSCSRFDKKTGECRNYLTQERPVFCKNTGRIFTPWTGCELANK